MLEYLHLINVGPAPEMELELAPRLNLLTGDNGLGKSFLLDVAWWVLTRKWPREVNGRLTSGFKALPREAKALASISFRLESKAGVVSYESRFDRDLQSWAGRRGRPYNPGLVIYAHADGGFSVWDPARNYWRTRKGTDDTLASVPAYVFAPNEVWDGLWMDLQGTRTNLCRGLVDDWAIWIREAGESARTMEKTLASLAAPGELIQVGPLRALSAEDARDYPTIVQSHSPEPVRVVHASAGLRRVAALAYMLMWSWERNVSYADSQGLDRAQNVILILDELEAHLHPRWQRSILSSVIHVVENLHAQAKVQVIASTHSPMVLASAEPLFDAARDAWFDLDLNKQTNTVELRRRPFVAHGDASNWLTSEAFDLGEARSLEAETALETARAVLRQPRPTLQDANAATKALAAAGIPDIDPFWVRWTTFVESLGGKV